MSKRNILKAIKRVDESIAASRNAYLIYPRGFAREGFEGGYAAGLQDALLALSGVKPGIRSEYWQDFQPRKRRT